MTSSTVATMQDTVASSFLPNRLASLDAKGAQTSRISTLLSKEAVDWAAALP